MYIQQSVLVIALAFGAYSVGSQNATKTIPLNKTTTWLDRELYSDIININGSSTIEFNFINVNNNVSFIIFQVHSFLYNVTVYNNTNTKGSCVTSTNVGLYSVVSPKVDTFYIMNPNMFELTLLISVHGYRAQDPVPGGCNMEFPIPVSPFMRSSYEKDYVLVAAAPARYYDDFECMQSVGGKKVEVKFYMLYLPERDYEAVTYFSGIKNMMSIEKISENGVLMPQTTWGMRRLVSAYTGMGAIYVAVAFNTENPDFYSVYVPVHNYACTPSSGDLENDCEMIEDMLSKFICASLVFVGLFVCYFGHRFFKTEMFVFGMLSGVVITYIIISIMAHLDRPALLSVAVLSGIFFGAIWMTFWWFYGIPVIAVTIPAMNLGFLLSAIIYSKLPGDVSLLQDNLNFWVLFIMLMVLSSMLLVCVTFVSNILCCAVLGAYAVMYPMDFYLGSNLKFIIINTVRRATVPKFNKALIMMPFQWRDALLVFGWAALAVSGFLFQHYHNRGRPPFPPPPRSVRPGRPENDYGSTPSTSRVQASTSSAPMFSSSAKAYNERTPLLA